MSTQVQTNFKRYEKKFFLTPTQYKLFTIQMQPYVKADAHPQYTICNLYYDTDNYRLIRASIEKPVYKEKLRIRSYGVPTNDNKVFVELKKKYEGVVYKRRITTYPSLTEPLLRGMRTGTENEQICKELSYFQSFYQTKPKVFIAYDRQAFQGIENPDLRITFDTNLRYRLDHLDLREGDFGEAILNTDNLLMEIKIPGTCPLWLTHILSELKITSTSFSKYGTCYREHILKNNTTVAKEMRFSA
ncbi:MAG: polyphosphate polymerase domain-containing protein [Clostridia bacterium]|nr:polyphosphate polymerase domain-containing protein [Clostridia bacterium]